MKFEDFGKNLSGEIKNLFTIIGNGRDSKEATHRLDDDFSMEDIIARIKNLDIDEISKSTRDDD